MTTSARAVWLGRRRYAPVHELQKQLQDARKQERGRDCILLVEHEPVITLGKAANEDNILLSEAMLAARGVDRVAIGRGGDVTYHGPGQLVIYPILRVRPFGVGDLVRGLAAAINRVVATYGISADYDVDNPGLWVDGGKICAVGMRVARGVSTHGAALNVTTALEAFDLIVPCAMPGSKAAAVQAFCQKAGRPTPSLSELADRIGAAFAEHFGFRIVPPSKIDAALSDSTARET